MDVRAVWGWVKRAAGEFLWGKPRADEDSYRHFFWPDPSLPKRCRECGQYQDHHNHAWEL